MTSPAPAATTSRGSAWKIIASVLVVTGAVAFLLSRSLKEGAESYKHVDEVMTNLGSMHGKRLQVHGHVVDGSIEQKKGTLEYRFKIESREPRQHAVISASYTGLVPDTFKSGAEVVARGMLVENDRLEVIPDGIMAKCPSKYEAAKPGTPGATKAPGIDPNTARQL
ncbi:MAG TPA: cytochrome c maturation protein CcmE [Polyangia bacterium]|jgi:cytochrome c-type biogenesis protein CcmE|nr:cytochrome c maturation protein CcmE [Polyangia bacterium]